MNIDQYLEKHADEFKSVENITIDDLQATACTKINVLEFPTN